MAIWLVLVPVGVEVEVRTSSAIREPILVTDEQIQAVALAAAQLLEAGLPVDVGQLLTQLSWPARDAAQQVLWGDASPRSSADEQAHQFELDGAYTTAPEDFAVWPCACGAAFTTATGGQLALKRHQATCALYQGSVLIPPDRRVDE